MEMKYGRIAAGNTVNTAIYRRCFEHVTEEDARGFVKLFAEQPHDGEQVVHTFRELILGAFLCREGFPARHDVLIDGQTPDWTVMAPNPTGIVELVNFHIDKVTEDEIRATMASRGSWAGWPGSNVDRLYDRIWAKAGTYRELRQRRGIPYVIGVFATFTAFVTMDEVLECLHHPEHGLFGMYPDLSGVLYFEEGGGRYFFEYIPNPKAERPWHLPSGVLDCRGEP
jgi:hypothetical protein